MSMFTRRHYVWLASVARDMAPRGEYGKAIRTDCVNTLANALENEGGGFDKQQFLRDVLGPGVETVETTDENAEHNWATPVGTRRA